MAGIQVLRFELRASLDGPLYDHVRGLTRPPTGYGLAASEAPERETAEQRQARREGGPGAADRSGLDRSARRRGRSGRGARGDRGAPAQGPRPTSAADSGCARGGPAASRRRRRVGRRTASLPGVATHSTGCAHAQVPIWSWWSPRCTSTKRPPHLQALFVPIERGRLAWKAVRDGAAKRIREELGPDAPRKSRGFRDSYRVLQDDYQRQVGARYGLARGAVGSEATHEQIDRQKAAEIAEQRAREEAERARSDAKRLGAEADRYREDAVSLATQRDELRDQVDELSDQVREERTHRDAAVAAADAARETREQEEAAGWGVVRRRGREVLEASAAMVATLQSEIERAWASVREWKRVAGERERERDQARAEVAERTAERDQARTGVAERTAERDQARTRMGDLAIQLTMIRDEASLAEQRRQHDESASKRPQETVRAPARPAGRSGRERGLSGPRRPSERRRGLRPGIRAVGMRTCAADHPRSAAKSASR